jgi:hypothetical protein
MRSIEATATVTPDGTLTVRVPPEVPPGEHRVVVVIDEAAPQSTSQRLERPPLDFPVRDYGPWPEGLSLRREDMYGDDGR